MTLAKLWDNELKSLKKTLKRINLDEFDHQNLNLNYETFFRNDKGFQSRNPCELTVDKDKNEVKLEFRENDIQDNKHLHECVSTFMKYCPLTETPTGDYPLLKVVRLRDGEKPFNPIDYRHAAKVEFVRYIITLALLADSCNLRIVECINPDTLVVDKHDQLRIVAINCDKRESATFNVQIVLNFLQYLFGNPIRNSIHDDLVSSLKGKAISGFELNEKLYQHPFFHQSSFNALPTVVSAIKNNTLWVCIAGKKVIEKSKMAGEVVAEKFFGKNIMVKPWDRNKKPSVEIISTELIGKRCVQIFKSDQAVAETEQLEHEVSEFIILDNRILFCDAIFTPGYERLHNHLPMMADLKYVQTIKGKAGMLSYPLREGNFIRQANKEGEQRIAKHFKTLISAVILMKDPQIGLCLERDIPLSNMYIDGDNLVIAFMDASYRSADNANSAISDSKEVKALVTTLKNMQHATGDEDSKDFDDFIARLESENRISYECMRHELFTRFSENKCPEFKTVINGMHASVLDLREPIEQHYKHVIRLNGERQSISFVFKQVSY
ncbi:hypothetical protein MHBO_000715 [Bonamia ostreae]|uniref:Uncharacterized protein n=1 Tax=Bonamia ostreae TaxID=126728 RepID=A0ABV2AGJ7_9EUKA